MQAMTDHVHGYGTPEQERLVEQVAESALAQQPDADQAKLRVGLADLRSIADHAGAGLGWVLHKPTATR